MVKQLIVVATPLLIHDALEAIQCVRAILDFTMLARYVSHDNETLRNIEHVLYRLENTKIAFEHHRPIDSQLCRPTFNYPKFHAISHFVQCIRDYGSVVNYDTTQARRRINTFLKRSTIGQIKRSTTHKFDSITYAIPI